MKKIIQISVLLMFVVFASSCSGVLKTEVIKSQSTNGEMKIEVWGERRSSLDPFTTYVKVSRKELKLAPATTEIYADDLNTENVQFFWKSNNSCFVQLTHRDGKISNVPVTVVGD